MKELQQRQNFKKIMYSWGSLLLIFLLAILMIRGAYKIGLKYWDSAQKLKETESQTIKLREREAKLEGEVAELKTSEGVEAYIREKFNAVKEGESVVVIIDEKRATTSSEEVMPWYRRIWSAIMNFK